MTSFKKTLNDTIIPHSGSGLAIQTDGLQNYVSLGQCSGK